MLVVYSFVVIDRPGMILMMEHVEAALRLLLRRLDFRLSSRGGGHYSNALYYLLTINCLVVSTITALYFPGGVASYVKEREKRKSCKSPRRIVDWTQHISRFERKENLSHAQFGNSSFISFLMHRV